MLVRAESAASTRRHILAAATRLAYERIDLDSITLDQIADRAGVTAMTILRHFGDKKHLLTEIAKIERKRVIASRRAVPGDIKEAVRVLYDHYDELGDWGIRAQARELVEPSLRRQLNQARLAHRRWVEETFAPQIARSPVNNRSNVIDALVVATDVLTWKLLCRDLGRPRKKAEATVRDMIEAIEGAG